MSILKPHFSMPAQYHASWDMRRPFFKKVEVDMVEKIQNTFI